MTLITDQSVNIFFIVSQWKAINELSDFQRCSGLMGDMLRLDESYLLAEVWDRLSPHETLSNTATSLALLMACSSNFINYFKPFLTLS